MKLVLAALLGLFFVSNCLAEESDVKIIFRDFNLISNSTVKAFSVALCSWTDEDYDCSLAGYLNFNFISLFKDRIRFAAGFVGMPAKDHVAEIRLDTALTVRIFDNFELGSYWCPFWGLAGKEDPFGLMIGFTF